eukprot:scaffold582791_cov55-Prasinocladus_malaysianus.AAC.1
MHSNLYRILFWYSFSYEYEWRNNDGNNLLGSASWTELIRHVSQSQSHPFTCTETEALPPRLISYESQGWRRRTMAVC